MGWAFRIEDARQRGETSVKVYLFTYRNYAGSGEGAGEYLDAVKKMAVNFLKERGYDVHERPEWVVQPRVGILFGTDLTEVVTHVHLGISWR